MGQVNSPLITDLIFQIRKCNDSGIWTQVNCFRWCYSQKGRGGGSQHQRVGRGLIFPSLIFERITKLALKKSGEGGGGGRSVRSPGKLKLLDRDSNLWLADPTFSQLNYEVKSANVTHSNRLHFVAQLVEHRTNRPKVRFPPQPSNFSACLVQPPRTASSKNWSIICAHFVSIQY